MELAEKFKPRARAGAAALILIGALLVNSCSREAGQKKTPPAAAPVLVAEVEKKSVPVTLSAIGAVEAINTVAVKAQVSGTLQSVHFNEGQHVGQGAPLFTIDPQLFRIAVDQAKAALERDTASADLARRVAERSGVLHQKEVLAKEDYERDRAAANALAATVRADRAALERARLDLAYCDIAAPIAGVAGKLQVTVGNLIPAQGLTLVTINQIAPIYVTFSAPQQRLDEIKKYMSLGSLPVTATLPGTTAAETGALTFVDNAVDPATGTILLKATFANAAEKLWPGQYVDVVLTLSILPDAVVVPTKAIQTGQKGPYVFVVKEDDTVDALPVTPGIITGDLTVIPAGLEPGQRVVVTGQLRLTPGAKVTIKSADDDPGPAKP
jgi:membrane fusion protein, multidrug efflux system